MIRLENMKKNDLCKIVEWNNDKSEGYLLKWAGPKYKYPLTLNELEDYFNNTVNSDNLFLYKIILEETNEIIGTIELREVENKPKSGWICGFLIGNEKYRGCGIGENVLRRVLKFAFEKLKFNSVGLLVFDFNISAIKCYEKVGFKKVDFKKDLRKYNNEYWSLYEMEILKQNWCKLH